MFNKKIIFLIIVVIIAGAGVLGYRDYQKNKAENPGGQTTGIDTNDWLTYRNEEYGFELKYPGDWEVSGGYKQENNYNIVAVKGFFLNEDGSKDGSVIKVSGYFSENNQDIKNWLEKNFPINLDVSVLHGIYNIKVAMQDAVYRVITSNVSGGYFNDITFQKGKNIYYIEVISRVLSKDKENSEKHEVYINGIVNSIKFIN